MPERGDFKELRDQFHPVPDLSSDFFLPPVTRGRSAGRVGRLVLFLGR